MEIILNVEDVKIILQERFKRYGTIDKVSFNYTEIKVDFESIKIKKEEEF